MIKSMKTQFCVFVQHIFRLLASAACSKCPPMKNGLFYTQEFIARYEQYVS